MSARARGIIARGEMGLGGRTIAQKGLSEMGRNLGKKGETIHPCALEKGEEKET